MASASLIINPNRLYPKKDNITDITINVFQIFEYPQADKKQQSVTVYSNNAFYDYGNDLCSLLSTTKIKQIELHFNLLFRVINNLYLFYDYDSNNCNPHKNFRPVYKEKDGIFYLTYSKFRADSFEDPYSYFSNYERKQIQNFIANNWYFVKQQIILNKAYIALKGKNIND